MTHTITSCKDSWVKYSVLSSVEAHRFQTSAYLFWQFQVLFGIDTYAVVLPWEYDVPPPEDRLFTRQSFLERIPVMSLLHLSAFKDYLLSWAEWSYHDLQYMGLIQKSLTGVTRGRYVPCRVRKAADVFMWTRAKLSSPLVRRSILHGQ